MEGISGRFLTLTVSPNPKKFHFLFLSPLLPIHIPLTQHENAFFILLFNLTVTGICSKKF